jgi:hypothetical protein
LLLKAFLIAFDEQHEITPTLLHNPPSGLHLRVQGIHQPDGPIQIQPVQQPLPSRNLVALVSDRFHSQRASTAGINRTDQLRFAAPPQGLPVQDHHVSVG